MKNARPCPGATTLLRLVITATLVVAPLSAEETITFDVSHWEGVLTANYLAHFEVANDPDLYDQSPHEIYWICLAEWQSQISTGDCDMISFNEGYGPGRGVTPFEEAVNPLRGKLVKIWVQAENVVEGGWDWSTSKTMRAALSNIALRPPGHEETVPFNAVYPGPDDVFESIDDFIFRWPAATTGLAGIWGGNNSGATRHELNIQLQQSSATCEKTKWACPGTGNVCADTDPLSCSQEERGYCTYTEPCAKISDQAKFRFDVTGLTVGSSQDVGPGRAWLEVINNFTYVVFQPHQELFEHLLSQVNADLITWRVATCITIDGTETCGRTENVSQYGRGVIGIPAQNPGGGGGGGLPPPGTTFSNSPLVDVFAHPACIQCHVLVREAEAGEGLGQGHLGLITTPLGGAPSPAEPIDLTNSSYCDGCHTSALAPQILGSTYGSDHGLGTDYGAWWDWFAPEYVGSLTWPDHLEDPASPDYDPATACALFTQATPTAESMKHHLFEDPRVIWSIVGGMLPFGNLVDQLAPPGEALDPSGPDLASQLDVLTTWESWVNDWVDGGMNCGTTYTGTSFGGGSNEDVNTTPPTTTSDGSSGTWVGGAVGSGDTTVAHLDCQPDQDSASDRCAWTFFACGSDASAVQTLIQGCSEETAELYKSPEVATPAGLCDKPVSDSCYKIDPADGSSGYYSVVQIPAEIGDNTTLSFFSIDAEGNQEVVRSEVYDFVEADLVAPTSGVELFYDLDDDEHKLRFSCKDNSDTCMIFYKSNDPGEDATPEFDMSTQLLNSHGGAFNSDGNILGYLKTDRVQRIRWAAIDGAAGQKNVEFDRLCKQDALDLCPGKLAEQNACVATCEDGVRADCELGCAASAGTGGEVEEDCVAACVAESPVDCLSPCARTCEPTNTGCPGTGGTTGVPLDKSCNSRTNPIQCYHEFVYDPALYYDTDPPEVFWNGDLAPRSSGTYERGFRVSLQCADPKNDCEIFYTTDGSEPTSDPRMRYEAALVVPEPATGRTATTTIKFFAQDDAVPPNASPIETVTLTVALPHTDDDGDGFSEDDGDCNDGNDQIFPTALEICDLLDNNCNGSIDEGLSCPSESIFSDGFESGSTSAWSR